MAISCDVMFSPVPFLLVCILLFLSRGMVCLGCWWSCCVFRCHCSDTERLKLCRDVGVNSLVKFFAEFGQTREAALRASSWNVFDCAH
jgi:hypothetical protein